MDIKLRPGKKPEKEKLRVAAYARVSSEKDAAFHSLSAQMEYYEHLVMLHPEWELVGVYSDEGVSGTKVDRPEFQRMMADARAGKLDLIITKSITRFARNTVVLLESIRELKSLGVDCFFEKENMHSISPDGELLITLLAMYAEEEARSASENQKWRIKKMFKEGKVPGGKVYGYKLVDGVYKIIPEEAEVVRNIFKLYLSGLGCAAIAKKLNEDGIPSPTGKLWRRTTMITLLRNRCYTGNLLLQTTYRENFRTKKTVKNHGELPMYEVTGSHEAIIDEKVFEEVAREQERRIKKYGGYATGNNPMFKCLVTCGQCGRKYTFKKSRGKGNRRNMWICSTFNHIGKAACPSQMIPDEILMAKALGVIKRHYPSLVPEDETLTRSLISSTIKGIKIPGPGRIDFYLYNGEIESITWKYESRSKSWTPEMREKARQKTKKRYERLRKEAKNEPEGRKE